MSMGDLTLAKFKMRDSCCRLWKFCLMSPLLVNCG
uniref:Uncharacterized protein n=1 Tax=Anguilla anguilla TaxID=7936 RepID=A0A0E9TRW8_ANGAN